MEVQALLHQPPRVQRFAADDDSSESDSIPEEGDADDEALIAEGLARFVEGLDVQRDHVRVRQLAAGEILCQEGDLPTDFIVLVDGMVSAWVGSNTTCVDVTYPRQVVRLIEAALHRGMCTATLIAHVPSRILCLPAESYKHLPGRALAVSFQETYLTARQHGVVEESWLMQSPLATCRALESWPVHLRTSALRRTKVKRLKKAQLLSVQHDSAAAAYLLVSGSLQHDGEIKLPGAVLAEWALLGVQREFTATAIGTCYLLELKSDDVQEAFRDVLDVATGIVQSSVDVLLEEALSSSCGSRSEELLIMYSCYLQRYRLVAAMDNKALLACCQRLYCHYLSEGDLLRTTRMSFCSLMSGAVSLATECENGRHQVATVPLFADVCSITSSSCCFKALSTAAFLCIDKSGFEEVMSGVEACPEPPCPVLQLPDAVAPTLPTSRPQGLMNEDRSAVLYVLRRKLPEERSDEEIASLERLVRGTAFYAQLEDEVRLELCRSMTWREFRKLEPVIKQGDLADKCFILLKGSVGIWVKQSDPDSHPAKSPKPSASSHKFRKLVSDGRTRASRFLPFNLTQPESPDQEDDLQMDTVTEGPLDAQLVSVLLEGACFGEAGLLLEARRNATILAREPCECGCISKEVFKRILQKRLLAQEQDKITFLAGHLPRWPKNPEHGRGLAVFFRPLTLNRGVTLLNSAVPAARLCILSQGICKVQYRRHPNAPFDMQEVSTGHVLGVASLLLQLPAEPYQVVCSTKVELLWMDATDAKGRLPPELVASLVVAEKERLAKLQARLEERQLLEQLLHADGKAADESETSPPRSPVAPARAPPPRFLHKLEEPRARAIPKGRPWSPPTLLPRPGGGGGFGAAASAMMVARDREIMSDWPDLCVGRQEAIPRKTPVPRRAVRAPVTVGIPPQDPAQFRMSFIPLTAQCIVDRHKSLSIGTVDFSRALEAPKLTQPVWWPNWEPEQAASALESIAVFVPGQRELMPPSSSPSSASTITYAASELSRTLPILTGPAHGTLQRCGSFEDNFTSFDFEAIHETLGQKLEGVMESPDSFSRGYSVGTDDHAEDISWDRGCERQAQECALPPHSITPRRVNRLLDFADGPRHKIKSNYVAPPATPTRSLSKDSPAVLEPEVQTPTAPVLEVLQEEPQGIEEEEHIPLVTAISLVPSVQVPTAHVPPILVQGAFRKRRRPAAQRSAASAISGQELKAEAPPRPSKQTVSTVKSHSRPASARAIVCSGQARTGPPTKGVDDEEMKQLRKLCGR